MFFFILYYYSIYWFYLILPQAHYLETSEKINPKQRDNVTMTRRVAGTERECKCSKRNQKSNPKQKPGINLYSCSKD